MKRFVRVGGFGDIVVLPEDVDMPIWCGEKTCFDPDRKHMCPWVTTSHFGSRWHCHLFGNALLKEEHGMLQRRDACKKAELTEQK